MLTHAIRTSLRYLRSRVFFTGVNLLGLTVGLSVCFLTGLYVQFELGYDAYHERADRIYRLVTDVETSVGTRYESTSAPMAPALQSAFAEVENATRILLDYLIVQPEDRSSFGEETVAYADPFVFSIFTLPLISGDATTALVAPFSVILSATAAQRFFGTTDCLGQTLLLDNSPATVTGVMQDMPANSHVRTDILVSMATLLKAWNPSMSQQWSRFGFYTYLLLPANANAAELSRKFTQYVRKRVPSEQSYSLAIEPLTQVYLSGKARGSRTGRSVHGSIRNVYLASTVALLVLFVACFNFINLTAALSLQRTKEVNVRRVLGASRQQLVGYFLLDAALISLVASLLALLLSALLLSWFNQLVGSEILSHVLSHWPNVGWLILMALLVGGISGSYPAWLLLGSPVADGFEGRRAPKLSGDFLPRVLIIAQFATCVVLMVATAVVYRQLDYLQSADPGFDKERQVVVDFHFNDELVSQRSRIKQQLTDVPGVLKVSLSSSVPGRANRTLLTRIEDSHHKFQELMIDAYFVDYGFLDQYDISVVAGRKFSEERASDTTEAMLVMKLRFGSWATLLRRKPLGNASNRRASGERSSGW